MENNFIPAVIKEVPSKTELKGYIISMRDNKEYTPIQKYVWIKGLEFFVKEGIATFQKPAIESFLQMSEGSINETILGVDVKITKERITETLEKYSYSENITAIENEIKLKQDELRLLNEKLKTEKQLEINHGIAKKDIWEENSEPNLSIRITLKK